MLFMFLEIEEGVFSTLAKICVSDVGLYLGSVSAQTFGCELEVLYN